MFITTHFNPQFKYHQIDFSDEEGITSVLLNVKPDVELSEKWIVEGLIGEVDLLPKRSPFRHYECKCQTDLHLAGMDLTFNERLNAYHPVNLRGVKPKNDAVYYLPTLADYLDCLNIEVHKIESDGELDEIEYNSVEDKESKASIAISSAQGPDSIPCIIETEDDIIVWHKTIGPEFSSSELDKMAKYDNRIYGSDLRGWLSMWSFEEHELSTVMLDEEEKTFLYGISFERLNLINKVPIATVKLGEGSLEVVDILLQPTNAKLLPKLKEVIEGIYSVKYKNLGVEEE